MLFRRNNKQPIVILLLFSCWQYLHMNICIRPVMGVGKVGIQLLDIRMATTPNYIFHDSQLITVYLSAPCVSPSDLDPDIIISLIPLLRLVV